MNDQQPFGLIFRNEFRMASAPLRRKVASMNCTGIAEQIESAEAALTVKQLSVILQCSPKLLYKMVEARTIPHYKVGVLVRFCPIETARWIRTRRCGRFSCPEKSEQNHSNLRVRLRR